MKRPFQNKARTFTSKKQKTAGFNIPFKLQQGELRRPISFVETRKTNHDGEKVMAHAMDYVHYSKVLVRISNMAGAEFGSEIRQEVETGQASEVSKSSIAPRAWCEADENVGAYPTEKEYKKNTRGDAPKLNTPLSAEEKEGLQILQKEHEENKKVKQNEWTNLRKHYLINRGKCITKILTECTSESMRLTMRNYGNYNDAINANSVAEFMEWYTMAVKHSVGYDDVDKEKLEIQKLLGSDEDHLKIIQLNGPQDYIMCVKNLLKDYKKLLLQSRIEFNQEELNAMDIDRFNQEVRRMENNIEYDVEHNGLFRRTIFRELRDSGSKNDNAITRAVQVLQATNGQDVDTPPYETISEMLDAMTILVNTVLMENVKGLKLYHQTRNEEKAKGKEDNIKINNVRSDVNDNRKKGCNYCLKVLKKEYNSKGHDWHNCFYNKNCSKYLGDDRKKAAEERAKGGNKISVNAMVRQLYNKVIDDKPTGRPG